MTLAHFKIMTWPVSLMAIVTPWWLPVLQKVSEYSAILLPVAGLTWLGLQMTFAIIDRLKRK